MAELINTFAAAFQKRSLPIFITRENKLATAVIMYIVAIVLYMTANHWPIFEPRLLEMGTIDLAVPFIPETVWIYVTEYFLFVAAFFLSKDRVNTNKYFYSFLGLQSISVAFFWIYPTTFPRDLFPLPQDLDAATFALFSHLRTVDAPTSCLPSLHVSSCYLSSFIFLDEQKGKFKWFFVWATLIALSTLTTKQHYLIDLTVGLALAVGVWWIFHRWMPYYNPKDGAQENR